MLRAETLTQHNLPLAHAHTLMCALRTMAAARRQRLQRANDLWILDFQCDIPDGRLHERKRDSGSDTGTCGWTRTFGRAVVEE